MEYMNESTYTPGKTSWRPWDFVKDDVVGCDLGVKLRAPFGPLALTGVSPLLLSPRAPFFRGGEMGDEKGIRMSVLSGLWDEINWN